MLGLLVLASIVSMTSAMTNCLPAAWLPEGSVGNLSSECVPYDGSRLPDCTQFEGQVNTTSFYHVHEHDCGLFWECGPGSPMLGPTLCLFECAACVVDQIFCPDGRLQFDCRYGVPEGPVCDFANNVNCHDCEEACAVANCPADQTCDPTTACRCSDCRFDKDCTGGQVCCDRNCADTCGTTITHAPTEGTTTTKVPTTTTKAPTTTPYVPTTTPYVPPITSPCPNDCCDDSQCPAGFLCVDGTCVRSCSENSECEGFDAVCNTLSYDNCQYCNHGLCRHGCAGDVNCPMQEQPCTGIHTCGAGFPGLVEITVSTEKCIGCSSGNIERGLKVTLSDPTSRTCTSDGLDNKELTDYTTGKTATFHANEKDGMGLCAYANLNFHITSGTAKWTGSGQWTGASHNPLCFYYYDATETFYIIYNCCDLAERALDSGKSTALTNCRSCVLGKDC